MMLTLMLTSKGVAGVPRAALVILTATLSTFGLPLEGAAHPARHRSDPRHGPDRRERHGQLHRDGGRGALGRRVRRRAGPPIAGGLSGAGSGAGGVRSAMRIAVTGAAGQLGQAMARRSSRERHDVDALARADLDVTDHERRVPRDGRPLAPTSSSTARPTTPWIGPRTTCSAALEVNAFARQVARARGRTRTARSWCTTAPTSSSTATADRPYVRRATGRLR